MSLASLMSRKLLVMVKAEFESSYIIQSVSVSVSDLVSP